MPPQPRFIARSSGGPGPTGAGGTGYFSVVDGHELTETELANSNLVIGSDGFVYQPVVGEGPFAGQITGFELAPKWLQDQILGDGGGAGGPTAAELAISRSQVQAQNLSTFVDSTVAKLQLEIDAGRLETEQALGEFNRRLDAFAEAGAQFRDIQQFTIPIGAEYAPGFGPGEIGERLGIEPTKSEVIMFDPFAMANEIVESTPNLVDIGVPTGDELEEAVDIAEGFL